MASSVAVGPAVRVSRQPAFTGRAALRREFLRALDSRTSDSGERLFHFTGEPGIGKTRLLRELAAEAEARGWAVCWSRYSAGDWAPFGGIATGVIDALMRYGLLTEAELGSAAIPLRALAGIDDNERPAGASAPDGLLASSLARAGERLSRVRPTFFVFEDIDRADAIVRAAISALVRQSPKDAIIATSDRGDTVGAADRRFVVAPLDQAELGALCHAATGFEVAPSFLRRLHSVSDGNPRDALDALERLASDGQLTTRAGQLVPATDAALIPRVADVDLIASLEPSLRITLAHAAIRGTSFRAADLPGVAGGTVAGELLESACHLGIIVAVNSHFEFRSDSLHEALLAALPPEERQRTHREVATEIQTLPQSRSNVLALGHHLANADIATERAKDDIEPLALAGELSFRASAWNDAIRYFETALRHANAGAADERQTAWLEGRLGWAHYRNLDTAAAHACFSSSLDWFRGARDVSGWADSLDGMLAVETAHTDLSRPAPMTLAEEFLEAAEGHLHERAYLLSQYSEMLYRNGDDRALAAAEEALALAEECEDPFLQHRAHFALGLATLRILDVSRASAAFSESAMFARTTGDVKREGIALQNLVPILVATGRFAEAKAEAERALACADAVSDWAVRSFVGALLASIAVAEGEFDDADAFATDSQAAYLRSHIGWTPPILYSSIAYSRILRGRAADAMDLLDLLAEKVGKGYTWPLRALAQLDTADHDLLRDEVARRFPLASGRALDLFTFTPIAVWALLAKELDLPDVGQRAADLLAECHAAGLRFGLGPPVSLSRAMHGWRSDEAEAPRECESAGARAELAMALEDSAPMRALAVAKEAGMRPLAARLEQLALAHPDEAEFDVLRLFAAGVTPADIADRLMLTPARVARVLSVLGSNQVPAAAGIRLLETSRMNVDASPVTGPAAALNGSPAGARRVPLVALFTDIENSTAVNHAVGDEAWVVALAEHDALVRSEIVRAGGTVIKSGGDGFFAVFESVDGALVCAESIQRRFPLTVRHHPAFAIRVRAGIHCGAAYLVNADYHGVDVTLAARLCAWGKAGQTLVSDAVRRRAARPRFEFVSCGRAILKGFEDPVAVYEAVNLGGK